MPGSIRRPASEEVCTASADTSTVSAPSAFAAGSTYALSVLGDAAVSETVRAADESARLVSVIEADVIPRLLMMHRIGGDPAAERSAGEAAVGTPPTRRAPARPAETARAPAPVARGKEARRPPSVPARLTGKDVADLIELVRHDAVDAGLRYVTALRRKGHPDEELFTMLLAPAARQLGEMWVSDDVSFLEVTLAVSRLQRLLFELCQTADAVDPGARSVLLSVTPGEQHTLGMHMAACAFRRAGARVVCLMPTSVAEIEAAVRKQRFDLIGFSLGSECRLDLLAGVIEATRVAARQTAMRIVVGGPGVLQNPEAARRAGADRAVKNVTEAIAMIVESRVN